jgi:hypothetical protein
MLRTANVGFFRLAVGIALVSALFALPALSQDQAAVARTAAGCGPSEVQFDVKTDKKQHPVAQPEAGKALVYVIEAEKSDRGVFKIGAVTTRVGLDGAWVGANHGASYFYFAVEPGEHRLCTDWQSSFKSLSKLGSAVTFTAEAGKVYYFRAEIDETKDHPLAVKLQLIDQAEAQFLISSSSLSSSHPKEVASE